MCRVRHYTGPKDRMHQAVAGWIVAHPVRRANQPKSVKPQRRKYFALPEFRFTVEIASARAAMRDVSRSSRSGVRVAMGRSRRQVIRHPAKRWRRPAKSCGPGAATLASIHAALWWRGNGDNKGRSPGRARISRQTIARGKPGCLGCTCQTRVHSTLRSAHGAAGAVGARLSLRPPVEEGQ